MTLKNYLHRGSTWQFPEGKQPAGAVLVDGPAYADDVAATIAASLAAEQVTAESDRLHIAELGAETDEQRATREASEKAAAEEREAAELDAEIEAERVAAEAAEAARLEAEAQKAPAKQRAAQNKAATPATK